MGFFKDVRQVQHQAHEISANSPRTGARLREMNERMAAANASMASATATAAVVATAPVGTATGRAHVVSVGAAGVLVDGTQLVDVSVLVLVPGGAPVPSTVTLSVPISRLGLLAAGATLDVRMDPQDPTSFVVDWGPVG